MGFWWATASLSPTSLSCPSSTSPAGCRKAASSSARRRIWRATTSVTPSAKASRRRSRRRAKRPDASAHSPHVIEDGRGGPAIHLEAVRLLVLAECRARQHTRLAVDLVTVEPALREDLLHALELGGLELGDLAPLHVDGRGD